MSQHPAYELFEELAAAPTRSSIAATTCRSAARWRSRSSTRTGRRDPRHRERFLREAQFLAQFEHDNVLRVYSVDTERGWIIMELMKGTLASIIAAGPSDPDLVRSVLKQTLDALAFLHEKNKVHGTVRPTNLLINDAGRVKLSEFEQTDVGGELRAPKGSKKYLAPELIRPEFGDFGPPLDLYCLGFTALEMLKGPQFESLFPGTGKGAIDRRHRLAAVAQLAGGAGLDAEAGEGNSRRSGPRARSHAEEARRRSAAVGAGSAQGAGRSAARGRADRRRDDDDDECGTRAQPAAWLRASCGRWQRSAASRVAAGASPAVGAAAPAAPAQRPAADKKASSVRKAGGRAGKLAHPRFSKDWWNQQLGRPYVLYPLCAVILLGALWFSFFRGGAGPAEGAGDVRRSAGRERRAGRW